MRNGYAWTLSVDQKNVQKGVTNTEAQAQIAIREAGKKVEGNSVWGFITNLESKKTSTLCVREAFFS